MNDLSPSASPPLRASQSDAQGTGLPAKTLVPGQIFGPYRIDGPLGSGGMGVVYKATHQKLQRVVALKLMKPNLARDTAFSQLFMREARTAAQINHPAVVTIYDADELDGLLYMAFEYVPGGDLADKVGRSGALDAATSLRLIGECASGLHALFRAGLLHRDIKPQNIFLDGEGHAKLGDFGLARASAGDDRVTMTGATKGTPAYMAPEQAEGAADIDIRADIHALGATLFTLLTASVPFHGPTPWAVVAKVMRDPPPDPRLLRPDLPPAVAGLVLKAMAKSRLHRHQTPHDFGEDVQRVLASVTGAPAPWGGSGAFPIIKPGNVRRGTAPDPIEVPAGTHPAAATARIYATAVDAPATQDLAPITLGPDGMQAPDAGRLAAPTAPTIDLPFFAQVDIDDGDGSTIAVPAPEAAAPRSMKASPSEVVAVSARDLNANFFDRIETDGAASLAPQETAAVAADDAGAPVPAGAAAAEPVRAQIPFERVNLIQSFFDPWYEDGGHHLTAKRPDVVRVAGFAGKDASRLSSLEVKEQVKVAGQIGAAVSSARRRWPQLLGVAEPLDIAWLRAFDRHFNQDALRALVAAADPRLRDNPYLVLCCELGAVIAAVMQERCQGLQWLGEMPFFDSALFDPRSGNTIPVFAWAITRMSDEAVGGALDEKVSACIHLLDDEARAALPRGGTGRHTRPSAPLPVERRPH